MAKIQFSGNSINAYENLKHSYANSALATSFTSGKGKTGSELWETYASNDMLDSLVSVYMNSDKLGSISDFESKYSNYDYMTSDQRIAAASTELYADRETLNTYERYKTDEDGNMLTDADGNLTYETEEYEDTEYNYYKSYLESQAEYNKELYLTAHPAKVKEDVNGFVQFWATAASMFGNLASSTLTAFTEIPKLLTASFYSLYTGATGGDMNNAFRDIMTQEWNPFAEMIADFDAKYTWNTDDYGNATWWGNIVYGVSNTIGMMVPSLVGQGIAKGISAGASALGNAGYSTASNVLNGVANATSKISSASYWVTMGTSTLEDYCKDENLQSVNVGYLILMAAATTTYEALVTKAMNTLVGGTQMDKLLFGSSTEGVSSTLSGKFNNKFVKTVVRIAIDGLKEGIEEVWQEAGTALINNIAASINEGFSSYSQFTGSQMGMAVGLSFITTAITSGVGIINNRLFGTEYSNNVVTDKDGNIVLNKDGTIKYKKMSWVDALDYKEATSGIYDTLNKINKKLNTDKDLSAKDRLKFTAAIDDLTHMVQELGAFYNANADDMSNVLKIVDKLRDVSSSKGKTTEYYTSKTVTNDIKDVFTENDDKFGTVNTKKGELSAYDAVNNVVKIKNGYRIENADGTSTEYRRFKNGGYSVTHLPDYATIAQNILEELGVVASNYYAKGLDKVKAKQVMAEAQVTKATAVDNDNIKESLKNANINQNEVENMTNKINELINAGVQNIIITDGNAGKSELVGDTLITNETDLINVTTQQIMMDMANNSIKRGLTELSKFRSGFNTMFKSYTKIYGNNVTEEEFINALLINDDDIIYKIMLDLVFNHNDYAAKQLFVLPRIIEMTGNKVNAVQNIINNVSDKLNNNVQNAIDRIVSNPVITESFITTFDRFLTSEQKAKSKSTLDSKITTFTHKLDQPIVDNKLSFDKDDVQYLRIIVNSEYISSRGTREDIIKANQWIDAINDYINDPSDENLKKVQNYYKSGDYLNAFLYGDYLLAVDKDNDIIYHEDSLEDVLLNEFYLNLSPDANDDRTFDRAIRKLLTSNIRSDIEQNRKTIKTTAIYKVASDIFAKIYSKLKLEYSLTDNEYQLMKLIAQRVGISVDNLINGIDTYVNQNGIVDNYIETLLMSYLEQSFYSMNDNFILTFQDGRFKLVSKYTAIDSNKSDLIIYSNADPETRTFKADNVGMKEMDKFVDMIVAKDLSPTVRAGITLTNILNNPFLLDDRVLQDIKENFGTVNLNTVLCYVSEKLYDYNTTRDSYSISRLTNGEYVFVRVVKAKDLFTKTGNNFMDLCTTLYSESLKNNLSVQDQFKMFTKRLTEAGIAYVVSNEKYKSVGKNSSTVIINLTDVFANVPGEIKNTSIKIYFNENTAASDGSVGNYDPINDCIEIYSFGYDLYESLIHEYQHTYQKAYGRSSLSGLAYNFINFVNLDDKIQYSKFTKLANELVDTYSKEYDNFRAQHNNDVDSLYTRLAFVQHVMYRLDINESEAYNDNNVISTIYTLLVAYDNSSTNTAYVITTPNGNTYRFTSSKSFEIKTTSADKLRQVLLDRAHDVSGSDLYFSSTGPIPVTSTNDYNDVFHFDSSSTNNSSASTKNASINYNGTFEATSRYVDISTAKNTNLRYYGWEKGIVNSDNKYIDESNKRIVVQMEPKLQNFIVLSDLNLLDSELTDLIKQGKLTYSHGKNSIMQYIHDAENINDYTFNQIMKYIFPDSKVKDFKTLKAMTDDVTAAQNYAVLMTMRDLGINMNTVVDLAKNSGRGQYAVLSMLYNTLIANEKFVKVVNKYQHAYTTWSNKYDVSERFNSGDLRMLILRNFDGSARSLLEAYGMERWIMVHNRSSSRSIKDSTLYTVDEEGNSKNITETVADDKSLNLQNEYATLFSDMSIDDMIRDIVMADVLQKSNAGEYKGKTPQQVSQIMATAQEKMLNDFDEGKVSETDIQNLYYAKILKELNVSDEGLISDIEKGKIKVVSTSTADSNAMYVRTDKNVKDNIRNTINRNILPNLNSENIEEFRKKYPDIKFTETLNEDGTVTYKFDGSTFTGKSSKELTALEDTVKNLSTEIKIRDANNEATSKLYAKIKRQLDKSNERLRKTKEKLATDKKTKTKTVKVKTNLNYDYEFEVASTKVIPESLQKILNAQMSDAKFAKTDVKNISDGDQEHAVQSAEKILTSIDDELSNLTDQDIEDIVDYYSESSVISVNMSTTEGGEALRRYYAVETVVLTYLLSEYRHGNINLTEDQRVAIETILQNLESVFGTGLSVWKNALQKLNPAKIRNERIARAIQIKISDDSLDSLSNAMNLEPGKVYTETELRRLLGDAVVDSLKLNFISDEITVDNMKDELTEYYSARLKELIEQGKNTKDKAALKLLADQLTEVRENLRKLSTANNVTIYNMYTTLSAEVHKESALTADQKKQVIGRLMRSIESEVLQGYTNLGDKGKQKLVDKLVDWERMMMLSSPGTWLRNAVSNSIVKYTTRVGGMLGSFFNKKFMKRSYSKNEAYMIDNMIQTSQALEQEIVDTKTKIAQTKAKLSELDSKQNKEIARLQAEVDKANKHVLKLSSLKADADKLIESQKKYNAIIKELNKNGYTYSEQGGRIDLVNNEEYDNAKKQYNRSVQLAKSYSKSLTNLKAEIDYLTTRIKNLTTNPELQADTDTINKQLKKLKSRLKSLEKDTSTPNRTFEESSEISLLKDAIENYEFMLRNNGNLSELEKQWNELNSEYDELQKEAYFERQNRDKLRKKITKIENKTIYSENIRAIQKELNNLRYKLRNVTWSQRSERIQGYLNSATDTYKTKLKALNDYKEQANTARQPYVNEMDEAQTHLDELTAKRSETVQGLDILIQDLQTRIARFTSLTPQERHQYNAYEGMSADDRKVAEDKVANSKYDTYYEYQVAALNQQLKDYKTKRKDLMKKKQYRITGTEVSADTKAKVKSLFYDPFYTKINDKGETTEISFYDAIADGLSRYSDKTYNPLNGKNEESGDQIVELIVTTFTAKIFNDNRFTSKSKYAFWQKVGGVENFLNKVLFKALSDDPWIKKRTQELYGKMITELNLDTNNLYNRASLQVFADAYVYASWEYMHRQNFFTKIEQFLHEGNSTFYFLYKQFAPFASASWNWCMTALDFTPIGMAKGIYDVLHLEQRVNKMSEKTMYGSVPISSSFTLYEAQKTLGKGLLGTLFFVLGGVAMGVGLFAIDDEDDTIKLRFSDDVYLDITNLYGNSGFLLGAVMVSGIQDAINNGMSFNKFFSILGQMSTSLLNDTILNSIFESVSYSDSLGDYIIDSLVDSFGKLIPNIWKVFAQTVNSGVETKYESGILGSLEYLANQVLPGIAYAMPKKYNIWTGELEQDHPLPQLTTLLNKLFPVDLDIYTRSEAEKIAKSLGLSKTYLTGNYSDIGKLDNYQVQYLNKMYGELNSKYLEDFINNKTKYKVQNSNGTYSTLLYSQMTSEQIKSVINRIMTNDATYAKIYVYTNYMNGKYYADEDTYTILKKLGISKNVYRESTKYSGYV